MSDTTSPAGTVTTVPGRNTAALDAVMRSMTGHASFLRGMLDDAASLIQTARDDRNQGMDVGVALNHARMLLEQIEFAYPSLNDLAEGVTALYENRSRHWTTSFGRVPMSDHVYPDIQDRIDQLRSRLEQVRSMDAGVPDRGSPEAYRHLIRHHDIGHIQVLDLAQEDAAPPSLAAASILHMHYTMMCCIKGGRSFYRGDRRSMQTIVEWVNWTGWAFHNMAEMTTGKHDRWHPGFFVAECRSFVESARTKPVPADWHPDSGRSDDHPGPAWKRLCDFVARQAGMDPAYGVPVESTLFEIAIPPSPTPPKAVLGLYTARSLERYWLKAGEWCHDWVWAQRAAMSLWSPSDPSRDDQSQ